MVYSGSINGGSNERPRTGDGKTSRDIYEGKENFNLNGGKGTLKVVYKEGKSK